MLRMSWLSSVRLLRTGDQVTEHLLNETFCVHFMCTKSLFLYRKVHLLRSWRLPQNRRDIFHGQCLSFEKEGAIRQIW